MCSRNIIFCSTRAGDIFFLIEEQRFSIIKEYVLFSVFPYCIFGKYFTKGSTLAELLLSFYLLQLEFHGRVVIIAMIEA